MKEIARNPVRLQAWWWHMAKHHERLAREGRARARRISTRHHLDVDYLMEFESGAEMIAWAETSEAVSAEISKHIDALVRSTLEPARCTCSR